MKNSATLRSQLRRMGRKILEFAEPDTAQAIVELAFLLPVASFLLVGTLEIGRMANASIVLDSAARAGVQYGAQNRVTASDLTGIAEAAQADASSFGTVTVDASHYCACSDGSSSTCQPTDCTGSRIVEYVKVKTQTQMNTLLPYPTLPKTYTVSQQEVMRVSQ